MNNEMGIKMSKDLTEWVQVIIDLGVTGTVQELLEGVQEIIEGLWQDEVVADAEYLEIKNEISDILASSR